jgi:hypothetical protein
MPSETDSSSAPEQGATIINIADRRRVKLLSRVAEGAGFDSDVELALEDRDVVALAGAPISAVCYHEQLARRLAAGQRSRARVRALGWPS